MLQTAIFRGFSTIDAEKIEACLGIKKEKFNTNEIIMTYTGSSAKIGLIVTGTADLVSDSYDGSRTILERYDKNTLFGEMFAPFISADSPQVIASSRCEVLLFQATHLFSPCKNTCDFHETFLANMLHLMTQKTRLQSQRIEILRSRSLRKKLMTFLEMQAEEAGSPTFTLPFSLYALADYISVDRCAMQREMKKMREEGLIASKGKKIQLL